MKVLDGGSIKSDQIGEDPTSAAREMKESAEIFRSDVLQDSTVARSHLSEFNRAPVTSSFSFSAIMTAQLEAST